MDKSKDDKQMELTPAPNLEDVRAVVKALVDKFITDEAGNKVTRNNMTGLVVQLMAAFDGQITLGK